MNDNRWELEEYDVGYCEYLAHVICQVDVPVRFFYEEDHPKDIYTGRSLNTVSKL